MRFATSQDTVIHAGRLVQIRAYGCRVACRRDPLEKACQWHSVAFMRRGHFVRTVDGRRGLIDRNHACFINRDRAYQVWHPDEAGDAVTEIEVRPDVLAAMADDAGVPDPEARPYLLDRLAIDESVYQAHWAIWRAATRGPDDGGLAIEESALRVVSVLLRHLGRAAAVGAHGGAAGGRPTVGRRVRTDTVRAHADLAHRTALLLSRRFAEPLDLETIARAVHASPAHLARVFRAQTGSTLHAYRTRLRLHAGLEALVDPDVSLAGLARTLGFASQSHFTDAFRRAFGRPPAAVRESSDARRLRETSRILEDRVA